MKETMNVGGFPQKQKLRLLLIEDSIDDAELLHLALLKGGYDADIVRVENEHDMRTALERAEWDLIVSDFSLPQFSAPAALALLQRLGIDLPFIIVSGTIGEDMAVASMKAGAHDFVLKSNMARLVPAIERELREVEQRRERARAQQALRESETKHRSLIERAVFGIFQATEDGRFLTVNPAMVAMLGYESPEALAAVNLYSLCVDEHAHALRLAQLRGGAPFSGVETVWRRQDGETVHVRLSGLVISLPHVPGRVLEVIVEDTTQKHRLEEQLRHAQKMEAIGHLVGGIAHDFNNFLTAILGYGRLVLEEVQDRPELAADVDEIIHAGTRAHSLTSQLLAFSRKQVLAPRVLDLNQIVTDVQKLLRQVVGRQIRVDLQLTGDPHPVRVDQGQMVQVLMNLAVNARDAMPDGGSLVIRTAFTTLPAHLLRPETASSGVDVYVELAVADTGCGMAPDVQQRIFEPFFTTKGPDKGTGLGLSTVYGIIVQSGGQIVVESEIGRGTTFRIYLPAADQSLTADSVPARPERTTGYETILLVESDAMVRSLAERVLLRSGYRVLAADDGRAAERIAIEYPGSIRLLLTDIVLPGQTGLQLAKRLSADRPDLKVLFISGHPEDAIRVEPQNPRLSILQKPFMPDQLTAAVRERLDVSA